MTSCDQADGTVNSQLEIYRGFSESNFLLYISKGAAGRIMHPRWEGLLYRLLNKSVCLSVCLSVVFLSVVCPFPSLYIDILIIHSINLYICLSVPLE